jgi:hypothetical protein
VNKNEDEAQLSVSGLSPDSIASPPDIVQSTESIYSPPPQCENSQVTAEHTMISVSSEPEPLPSGLMDADDTAERQRKLDPQSKICAFIRTLFGIHSDMHSLGHGDSQESLDHKDTSSRKFRFLAANLQNALNVHTPKDAKKIAKRIFEALNPETRAFMKEAKSAKKQRKAFPQHQSIPLDPTLTLDSFCTILVDNTSC